MEAVFATGRQHLLAHSRVGSRKPCPSPKGYIPRGHYEIGNEDQRQFDALRRQRCVRFAHYCRGRL